MDIRPSTNASKITYPTLAALATIATISACQPQPQRVVGKFPAMEKETPTSAQIKAPIKSTPAAHSTKTKNTIKTEPQILVGRRAAKYHQNS